MQIMKQILTFTITTAVAVGLIGYFAHFIGFRNPGFAFVVNWIVMTWIAIIGSVLHFSLPPAYFRIRQAELDGRLYKFLGVRVLKKLIRRGPLSTLNPTIRLSGDRTALPDLERKMRDAEAGHLLICMIVIAISGYAAINGWWDLAAWLTVFNILMNVYPIMLQRFNRARLAPILKRARLAYQQESEA